MQDRETRSRRDALRGIAGLLAGGAGLTGARTAAADSGGPVHASGTRINQFRPDGDRFLVTSRFVSRDLEPHYGRRVVEFEPEVVHREAVPAQYRNPDRGFTVRFADTAVIGTFAEHAAAERAGDATTGDVTTQASYTGPLYVYNSSVSDPSVGDLGERTGPINTGWDKNLGMNASQVNTRMHDDGGWSTPWLGTAGDRYVILHFEGSTNLYTKKQDTHVGKDYGSILTPDQYHVRLYNLPDHSDDEYAVVGQAHLDPNDHGLLGSDTYWSFDESRREVTTTWSDLGYSTYLEYLDNGSQWESSNGYLGEVDV